MAVAGRRKGALWCAISLDIVQSSQNSHLKFEFTSSAEKLGHHVREIRDKGRIFGTFANVGGIREVIVRAPISAYLAALLASKRPRPVAEKPASSSLERKSLNIL